MEAAILFSIPMVTSSGVCWRWRSVEGNIDSTNSFVSYYDCLFDAQSNGYCAAAAPKPAKSVAAQRRGDSRR